MKRTILMLVFAMLFLASCASERARQSVRDGMLALDLPQQAFLEVWGKPDRTSVMSGDDVMKASVGGYAGTFFKGKETFQIWSYTSRQVDLIFSRQGRLVAWKTEQTVKQLAAPNR
jgi:hypothetical protein